MCPVQEMQKFAIRHHIENAEAIPEVFNHLAQARGLSIERYLSIVESKPDLAEFIAQIVANYE
jgi:hypothetical protein|tara:strand:+ start:1871 stop:2059 length:189 start_codon:yes stop_codon:yes gene_type:complete